MLLFFIMFIFFVFHMQFLLRNIFFGVEEARFFMFVTKYPFSQEVAEQSLWFVSACALGFLVGYTLLYRPGKGRHAAVTPTLSFHRKWRHELRFLNLMGLVVISYVLVVGGLTGFNYGAMTLLRESNGFIFELRMIYLLLLSHLLLNVNWRFFLGCSKFRFTRFVLFLYLLSLLMFQARSAIFELGVSVLIPFLMWAGDKVRTKYIIVLCVLLVVPNILVLGRMGIPEDTSELISGLFSIEYTILLVKFIGAAIESGYSADTALSFLPQVSLIVPSPLRSLFDIKATNTDYILGLSDIAGVSGGGFSMIAQLYTDFGWGAPFVFLFLGMLLGGMNKKASRVGRVRVIYATAPLLYSIFVLSFRNDFGVFLKYSIQLFIVAALLSVLLRIRLDVKNEI